jgi:hypothetical protein
MRHITSLSGWILALGVSLLGAACGGSGEDAATGAASGTGGAASSSSSTATAAAGTGGNGQGGQGTGSSATTSTGGQGTGGAAPGSVTPKLEHADLLVNCMPIVSPDPVMGSFTATYKNSGTLPTSATITSAKVVFGTSPKTLSWPITVSPAGGGPVQPGTTLSVKHDKKIVAGSAPEGSPCDFCDSTMTLTVTWDLGGGNTVSDTLPAEKVGCVF